MVPIGISIGAGVLFVSFEDFAKAVLNKCVIAASTRSSQPCKPLSETDAVKWDFKISSALRSNCNLHEIKRILDQNEKVRQNPYQMPVQYLQ
jgi:hypothetical protein